MGVCFLCDTKLYGERTRVCSSITPHSNVSYPEKIVELMGDEFVVIVTPADHMCKKCTSLLTHMDKLENDLKLVKNAMLSYIQKKYGILPPDQAVKGVEIVNGHIKAEEQLEQGQRKVPSGLTVGVSPTVTTAAVVTPVQTPIKLIKTQQQQQQQQQHQPQQQQQQPPPTQQESANKMKIYKCGFCTFQSKELGHVRFHMRTHMNKKEPEKPILNQAAAKALTPVPQQKKRLYRCQVCSRSFDSRINCLDHIQKDHNQPTPSTSNGDRETEDSRPVSTKVIKPEPSKTQENNPQAESPMDVDENQQDDNKGTVDTDMMLNDNVVPAEGSANVEQEEGTENAVEGEETENSQEDKTVKEVKSKKKPEPAQEEAAEEEEDEEDTAVPEQEEADQETPDSVEKEMDEDNANVENKTGDLDIESMLAAIHNDNPTNSVDIQNKD
ncbi:unnamed protein product [Macrosiphum euphorbiae]|uniref:C2H2-type domain-containing protein n=1 Tax=Macrosiphum euphorbiae TaxID=13131 RepID=A0AAV0WEW3_9HEMI|nr:unnamed protein product [Macrosiphum euphorbiae]